MPVVRGRSPPTILRTSGTPYQRSPNNERLPDAGIEPSVGSVGNRYDNAFAETINGLFKAEVIHRRGPWRSAETEKFTTLDWVDGFNNRRLLEPIGKSRRQTWKRVTMANLDTQAYHVRGAFIFFTKPINKPYAGPAWAGLINVGENERISVYK